MKRKIIIPRGLFSIALLVLGATYSFEGVRKGMAKHLAGSLEAYKMDRQRWGDTTTISATSRQKRSKYDQDKIISLPKEGIINLDDYRMDREQQMQKNAAFPIRMEYPDFFKLAESEGIKIEILSWQLYYPYAYTYGNDLFDAYPIAEDSIGAMNHSLPTFASQTSTSWASATSCLAYLNGYQPNPTLPFDCYQTIFNRGVERHLGILLNATPWTVIQLTKISHS